MDADTFTFTNGALRCTVALRGAQLLSLSDGRTCDEFIWQRDPDVWADSAPILFPVIGRLKDGAYIHRGQRYAMQIHGFARDLDFELLNKDAHGVTLQLRESAATLAQYPFSFFLRVHFALDAHSLHVSYEVANSGDEVLPFSLGSHPGFRIPSSPRGLDDWSLVFSEQERASCHRLDQGLLARMPSAFPIGRDRRIALSPTLFDDDALIFKKVRSRHVRLVHRSGRVRLSMALGSAPDLGIWARPGANYVCIEPWFGYDDDSAVSGELTAKPGIVLLPVGGKFNTGYAISVPPAPRK
ncbi:aldose 1-epimerase family protein [Massilia glaciei]|uniref:Aldose 1-epimerase family protein n=1 Tax=Massilia glaciei TaxID=1524097 RepID=A0A2U2HF85_9BURK|nr:aldose 1-epimerase family protein [Massilia glaciei]PWF42722.1 aldose 1-epimerase family protein [Massilia glaciei]